MINDILLFLGQAFSACLTWFDNLTIATGTWTLIFSFIVMFLVARFIINPFIGASIKAAASDRVKRSRSNSKGGEDS